MAQELGESLHLETGTAYRRLNKTTPDSRDDRRAGLPNSSTLMHAEASFTAMRGDR